MLSNSKSAVILIGRFNPPTVAHEHLIRFGIQKAKELNSDFFVFTTITHDKDKNPLNPGEKILFLKEIFPGVRIEPVSSIYEDALKRLQDENYEKIYFLMGDDRKESYENLIKRGKTKGDFSFDVHFISFSRKDLKKENMENISATRARNFAKIGDFENFSKIVAGKDLRLKKRMFDIIKERIG